VKQIPSKVVISLIGRPQNVFHDEPSAGVDPVARRWIWKFIKDNMTVRTVLLTTHAMDEAEALCNRFGIIAPWTSALNIFLDLYHVVISLLLFLDMIFK